MHDTQPQADNVTVFSENYIRKIRLVLLIFSENLMNKTEVPDYFEDEVYFDDDDEDDDDGAEEMDDKLAEMVELTEVLVGDEESEGKSPISKNCSPFFGHSRRGSRRFHMESIDMEETSTTTGLENVAIDVNRVVLGMDKYNLKDKKQPLLRSKHKNHDQQEKYCCFKLLPSCHCCPSWWPLASNLVAIAFVMLIFGLFGFAGYSIFLQYKFSPP